MTRFNNYQIEIDDKRRFDDGAAEIRRNLLIGDGSAEKMRERGKKVRHGETLFGFLHFWRRDRCHFIYSWALAHSMTEFIWPKTCRLNPTPVHLILIQSKLLYTSVINTTINEILSVQN